MFAKFQQNFKKAFSSVVMIDVCVMLLLPIALVSQVQIKATPELQRPGSVGQFKTTGAGEVKDEDGTVLALTNYESSDGVKLTMIHHRFDSEVESESFLRKQIARATKVISITKKHDNSGKVIGERAELTITEHNGSDNSTFGILWTNGPEFRGILSSSMKDNLLLERRAPN